MNLTENFADEPGKLKNVVTRTSQLGLISLLLSLGITVYYCFLGLFVSSIMVGCFSLSVILILTLQYFKILKEAQIYILAAICILLMVSAFIEGAATGQYFYFFPVLVVIPVIVDYKKSSNLEFGITFTTVVISFGVNFYVGHVIQPYEYIDAKIANKMLFANAGSALLLTLCFSLAYIYYERKYLKAIIDEKNSAIAGRTRFLSTMGHELRTPLNGIIGVLNIIEDEEPQNTKNENFAILKYCSNHMQQLINDILDFNKIEAGKLSIHPIAVNFKQLLVNSTLPFYNHIEEKKLQLIIEIDPVLDIVVLVDDVRLIQILNNLLSNAMKFTEKGFIKLVVACNKIDSAEINVSFVVEDSGIGIEKEDQGRIFESYWQVYNQSSRKYTGTGLGLTICLRLLELMGSSLKLTSKKGKGSAFSFELTLNRSIKRANKKDQVIRLEEDLSGMRILIVEDNKINMIIASKMLTNQKAICTPAFNGKEALELLEKNAQYDMILMDLEMPVMDGHTAIIEIKKLYTQLPVIAFTASLIDQEMLADLLEKGFEDCILKPFQPHDLFIQIKKHSRQKPEVGLPDLQKVTV
jgi:signal transduction histidine kinase/CheY-like chemotaxis protein